MGVFKIRTQRVLNSYLQKNKNYIFAGISVFVGVQVKTQYNDYKSEKKKKKT